MSRLLGRREIFSNQEIEGEIASFDATLRITKAQRDLSDREWVETITQLVEKIKGEMWNDDWGIKGVIYPDMLDKVADKFLKEVME